MLYNSQMLQVQTYKTQIAKDELKRAAKKLGYESVGDLINTAVCGLLNANGIKISSKAKADKKQLRLPLAPKSTGRTNRPGKGRQSKGA